MTSGSDRRDGSGPGGRVHRRRVDGRAGIFSSSARPARSPAPVWISFLLAGALAALQGYSFARLGARFPSAGGLIEYINQAFGRGHLATVMAGSATPSTSS